MTCWMVFYAEPTESKLARIVVPQVLVKEVVQLCHDTLSSAHNGRARTIRTVSDRFYWKGMHRDIRDYVNRCKACRRRKQVVNKDRGLAKPFSAESKFGIVSMDLVGPLTETGDGSKYILTMMDLRTRWPEAWPLKKATSEEVADCLFEWVARFGCPQKVLSDRGSQFISETFKHLNKRLGIDKIQTAAYRPQTNGVLERFHRYLGAALAMYVAGDGTDWNKYLHGVLMAYRTTKIESLNISPFEMMYETSPRIPVDVLMADSDVDFAAREASDFFVNSRAEQCRRLRKAFRHAMELQTEIKELRAADTLNRKPFPIFEEGDWVMLRKPPAKTREHCGSLKLLPTASGPHEVLKRNSDRSYKIRKYGVDNKPTSSVVDVNANRLSLYCKHGDPVGQVDLRAKDGILKASLHLGDKRFTSFSLSAADKTILERKLQEVDAKDSVLPEQGSADWGFDIMSPQGRRAHEQKTLMEEKKRREELDAKLARRLAREHGDFDLPAAKRSRVEHAASSPSSSSSSSSASSSSSTSADGVQRRSARLRGEAPSLCSMEVCDIFQCL